jgi:hypothetical protein
MADQEFRVTWEIDIIAGSHRQAALMAQKIQRDPESTGTVFKVAKWSGRMMAKTMPIATFTQEQEIDLGKEEAKW